MKNTRVIFRRQYCAICERKSLEPILALPKLPLTGRYHRKALTQVPSGIDQKLLICLSCGHVQLADQIDPAILYDSTYYFRTSTSQKAKAGTEFFLRSLNEIIGEQKFNCVLDVGCNDLHLLERLADRVTIRAGIDPIWIDQPSQQNKIMVIGGTVEDVDLNHILPQKPDLIVCRHTLEHIAQPKQVLEKLFLSTSEDAVFCFEIPGFDTLYERYRFDQVFHEHLNYYSLAIFHRLIEEVGGEVLGHRLNWHDWGALFIAFRKRRSKIKAKTKGNYRLKDIKKRYAVFQSAMAQSAQVLNDLPGPVYGFGAAQMLPVLGYHLKINFANLQAILDDDPLKCGLYYWNLPLRIVPSSSIRLSDVSIVLTAVDNAQPIMTRLMQNRPRNIVLPMVVI